MNSILAVFIGGGVGSVVRYILSSQLNSMWKGVFPLGTLIVNVLSCLVVGVFIAYFSSKFHSEGLKLFILVGFCGGFSTFSTFSKETLDLFQNGHLLIGIVNIAISIIFCLIILLVLANKST